jgi:lipid II:glycine glycyltransferase (peptidoglycan interpeptide bridge formation enzyme)
MWDLIRWAKREGARWFDFGGVTRGAEDKDDALAGISDFKRRFCRNEIALGEEWSYEPSRTIARIARFAGDSARWLSGLR